MRISDWSSDVCSSDLFVAALEQRARAGAEFEPAMRVGAQRIAQQQRARDGLEQRGLVAIDDPPYRQPLVPVHQAALARLAGQYAFDIADAERSEEHTSELQSLMRISYAVFCFKKTKTN